MNPIIEEVQKSEKRLQGVERKFGSVLNHCKRIQTRHYGALGQMYLKVTSRLNRESEVMRTHAEIEMLKLIETYCKLKVHTQVWIGTRCFDLFIPAIRSNVGGRGRGLAIEMDGGIHNTIPKMKKDFAKENFASKLGVQCHCIHNSDLRTEHLRNYVASFKDMPRMSYREYRRQWAKIHLATILLNGTDDEVRPFIKDSPRKSS